MHALCCGVQYFGDLVTCLWWDEIWLNEAFAVLYDYYGVNSTSPEWEMVRTSSKHSYTQSKTITEPKIKAHIQYTVVRETHTCIYEVRNHSRTKIMVHISRKTPVSRVENPNRIEDQGTHT